jgi:hypothetical protein
MTYSDSDTDIERETKRLWAQHRTTWGQIQYYMERLAVRSARIAAAIGILVFVYLHSGRYRALAHTHLASLTAADVFWLLVGAVFGFYLLAAAWWVAFGTHRAPEPEDFTQQASMNVVEQQAKQQRVAKAYAKSWVWGVLNDPAVSLQTNPKGAQIKLAVGVGIGVALLALFTWIVWLQSR